MSQSITEATVNTLIPREFVTDFERCLLSDHGLNCALDVDEEGRDVYFFYVDEFLDEECQYSVDIKDIQQALKIPENQVYIGGDDGLQIICPSYHDIFQNIIKRTPFIESIEIEGSFRSAKRGNPVRGEVGGFAEVITGDNVYSKGTRQILRDAYLKIENAGKDVSPISKDEGGEYNCFAMNIEGGTAWINVGDVAVHIVPGTKCVNVALYPKGAETLDELASANASYSDARDAIEEHDRNLPQMD